MVAFSHHWQRAAVWILQTQLGEGRAICPAPLPLLPPALQIGSGASEQGTASQHSSGARGWVSAAPLPPSPPPLSLLPPQRVRVQETSLAHHCTRSGWALVEAGTRQTRACVSCMSERRRRVCGVPVCVRGRGGVWERRMRLVRGSGRPGRERPAEGSLRPKEIQMRASPAHVCVCDRERKRRTGVKLQNDIQTGTQQDVDGTQSLTTYKKIYVLKYRVNEV